MSFKVNVNPFSSIQVTLLQEQVAESIKKIVMNNLSGSSQLTIAASLVEIKKAVDPIEKIVRNKKSDSFYYLCDNLLYNLKDTKPQCQR